MIDNRSTKPKLIDSILLLICLTLTIDLSLVAQNRITGKIWATRSEIIAQNGMACTSQPLATQVALDILKQGGSAVDAAIAANAVLGLVEPTGNGIGGDLFAIIWDAKTEQLYGLNASGRSPKSLTIDYFKEKGMDKIPAYGPLPVSVPGTVDGWFEMHQKFGTMDMADILQPAINYANNGFPVTELISWYWQRTVERMKDKYPNVEETFAINGKGPAKGQVFKNPYLANTLSDIAKNGRDAFYKGDIAKTIADFIQEQGGFLSYEDLASHESEWIEPVSTNYRGYDVWELPPNGQGIAALQILNIMEGYDVAKYGFGSKEYIHYFTEAKKLAFEDRAKYYADPAFNKIPVAELISKPYADKRRKLISAEKAARNYDAGEITQGETIYMTVADKDGNMVSLIQSNYRGMGSGMVPPKLGFMLQDRGELFSLDPNHFNALEPSKRPFHTIIPAFITKDGKPHISFGLMGGAMQPQGHAQIVMNLVDFGMNLQEAGDAPRISHLGSSQPTGESMTNGGTLYLENGFDPQVVRDLMGMGHRIDVARGIFGGYQAIMFDAKEKVYYGASESRKDGQAAGY
ncbi:MAG: gamma-glutamyltransferase [Chitinophagales bacterium]